MIFDIVLVVLCVLFILGGLRKGFMRSVISLCGILVTLLVTIFLAKPFAGFLSGFLPFDRWIDAPLLAKFESIEALQIQIPADLEKMGEALANAGIPGFLCSVLAKPLLAAAGAFAGTSLPQLLSNFVGDLIAVAIAAVILFILIRIAVAIVEHFAKRLTNVQFVKVVDRSLGAVLGAAKGILFILCIFTVMSMMMNLKFMAPVNQNLQESKFAKFLYENNFIAKFIFGKVSGLNKNGEEAAPETSPSPSASNHAERESAICLETGGKRYRLTLSSVTDPI